MYIKHRLYRQTLKRCFDVVASSLGLVLLSPVLLLVGLSVYLAMGRPVLFQQQRPGRGEALFNLRKFRTMHAPGPGRRTDAERLTRFGRFLRRTSLDELPALFNVLRGEMSLVGPRPLLIRYLPYYTAEERQRHSVRPGITGWAQVQGRNLLPWDERLALDVWYVENLSFLLDLRILLLTAFHTLKRSGVVDDPRSHMPDLDVYRATLKPSDP